MIFRRPTETTPPQILGEYVHLFNIAQVLDPADVDAMAERWASISEKTWYVDAAVAANKLAVKSGRLTDDGIVTGDLDDPEQGMIGALAGVVPGGGVVDVATAVLVHDLLPAVQYRQLTNWWSRHASTWLPGDTVAPAEEPPPLVQEPVHPLVQEPVRMPVPPRTFADIEGAGADPNRVVEHQILPGLRDVPTSPAPPRPRQPKKPARVMPEPPRDKVVQVAAERAGLKVKRRRSSTLANLRGVLLLLVATLFCTYAAGDQFGAQMLPPASIGSLGDGWGHLICALVWVAIGIALGLLAAGQFRLAKDIRRGN